MTFQASKVRGLFFEQRRFERVAGDAIMQDNIAVPEGPPVSVTVDAQKDLECPAHAILGPNPFTDVFDFNRRYQTDILALEKDFGARDAVNQHQACGKNTRNAKCQHCVRDYTSHDALGKHQTP
ncbi:MAG: hypothetical protein PHT98_08400, partial [Kiritimatiellae bacterium]|nr:hypothetical protein [Kiritimatiellia bacterium]